MLAHLSIRDLVLIEQVDLDFDSGLMVLTGETGAGKSILLDGLGLVLGERAEAAMVRKDMRQASVTAEFRVGPEHAAHAYLRDNDMDAPGGEIVLRRTIKRDGGSRAFVNDQPVTATALRTLGSLLVEIHGQHDERGLLHPRGHMALLDLYAGHADLVDTVAAAHARLTAANAALADAEARAEANARDREWLEHAVAELRTLHPQPGEEAELAEIRSRMQKGARLEEAIAQVETLICDADGALSRLRQAARRLERISENAEELQQALEAIDRMLIDGDGLEATIGQVREHFLVSPQALEEAETRLFDLRAIARKHRVEVDALPALSAELESRLTAIGDTEDILARLRTEVATATNELTASAAKLTTSRRAAASRLDAGVMTELPALKLESARFRTSIVPAEPGPTGADRVYFEIATNKGQEFGPLTRIASGGELSRFILALKVALASAGSAGTLIFDEIDRGVGGAVASAIGERLARLSHNGDGAQLLVVTHSPQVAAAGSSHFRISKTDSGGATRTSVTLMGQAERIEEIARMLSGAIITPEARAQAEKLLADNRA